MKCYEKKIYFNTFEFERAKSIAAVDPISGIEAYKEYLNKYPEDGLTTMYYISLLITVGDFKEAERLLNSMRAAYLTKQIFQKDELKAKSQRYNIHFCTIKLLAYQNKYQELLDYYHQYYDELKNLGAEIEFYYEKITGKVQNKNRQMNSYIFRQMLEYQEEDFKDHIKKHMADYNGNDASISRSFFNPDFPINAVIEEVKKYIPSNKRLNTGFIQNSYIFRYDECGRVDSKLVNYFKVTVFNNTCDFITMCPSNDYREYYPVDLNYMKTEEVSKPKVLSMIDRFNQRYKRNV